MVPANAKFGMVVVLDLALCGAVILQMARREAMKNCPLSGLPYVGVGHQPASMGK